MAQSHPQLNFHIDRGESPALCNSRRRNHKVERKELDTVRKAKRFPLPISKFGKITEKNWRIRFIINFVLFQIDNKRGLDFNVSHQACLLMHFLINHSFFDCLINE